MCVRSLASDDGTRIIISIELKNPSSGLRTDGYDPASNLSFDEGATDRDPGWTIGFETHAGQAIRQIDGIMGPDAGRTVRFGVLTNFWTTYFFRCDHNPAGDKPIHAQSVRVELAALPDRSASSYMRPREVAQADFVQLILLWRLFLVNGTPPACWLREQCCYRDGPRTLPSRLRPLPLLPSLSD
jgi:hypothetical protein